MVVYGGEGYERVAERTLPFLLYHSVNYATLLRSGSADPLARCGRGLSVNHHWLGAASPDGQTRR